MKAMGVNAYHLANSHGMPIPVIPEPETNFKEVFTLLPSTYKFLVESRIIEDVEYTGHFSYDGSKTQRIAKRSQPWSDLDEQSEICKIIQQVIEHQKKLLLTLHKTFTTSGSVLGDTIKHTSR